MVCPRGFLSIYLCSYCSLDVSSIYTITYPRGREVGQYHVCCAAMLLRHDEIAQWNYGICDIF